MRALVAILACAALVAGGATLAIASGGGFTRGHPSHHQYKPKPPCQPYHGKQRHAKASRKAHGASYGKAHYKGRGHCPMPKPRRP